MKCGLAVLTLLLLTLVACQRPQNNPQVTGSSIAADIFPDEKLMVQGAPREFRLIVPKAVAHRKQVPLVIAFHGMLIDSKDVMPWYTKLDELAIEKNFILAFPSALGAMWGITDEKVKLDLAFFDRLLAELKSRYSIDERRVYVIGMSNGGYFAHLVGKERSQTIAAVCSHSGPLGLQTLLGIGAQRKFPVMIVHGDQDNLLSVNFARENRDKYRGENHTVEYVEVEGLKHEWATATDINHKIWKFFQEHPLP